MNILHSVFRLDVLFALVGDLHNGPRLECFHCPVEVREAVDTERHALFGHEFPNDLRADLRCSFPLALVCSLVGNAGLFLDVDCCCADVGPGHCLLLCD